MINEGRLLNPVSTLWTSHDGEIYCKLCIGFRPCLLAANAGVGWGPEFVSFRRNSHWELIGCVNLLSSKLLQVEAALTLIFTECLYSEHQSGSFFSTPHGTPVVGAILGTRGFGRMAPRVATYGNGHQFI